MKKAPLKTRSSFFKENIQYQDSLNKFNLPKVIEKLKHEYIRVDEDLNAVVLLKSCDKNIVLTALHEGIEINSFQGNDSITFQIIEGKLKYKSRKESGILEKGQLLTLRENINYSLKSREETVFLSTIRNGHLQTTVI